MKKIIHLILLALSTIAYSQEKSKDERQWTLNGYISNMQSALYFNGPVYDTDGSILIEDASGWTQDGLIHNRLNFDWHSKSEAVKVAIQARNRLIYGSSASSVSADDPGVVDLSWNVVDSDFGVFNTQLDRAYLQYTKDKWDITVGRQRINWGISTVWNANDIFNTYSFFDFDYMERPGSDAIRAVYYPSFTSYVETAVKVNMDNELTAAAMYHFNTFGYDFQVMGGMVDEDDWVLGTGFSGSIKEKVGFKGEMSYFVPMEDAGVKPVLSVSVGLDYMFDNSLYLQTEVLYNESASNMNLESFADFYTMDLSAKNLSFSEYSVYGAAMYPITPLLNGTFSAMYYPSLNGWFAGPSFDYSLRDDLGISFVSQLFTLEDGQDNRMNFALLFMRLKYNF